MTCFRFCRVAIAFCIGLFFLCLPFSAGQDISDAPDEQSESFKIKLSVNEVRLDVVALDGKGNPVTDLTAADFEVFQNGKRQNVLASVYVDTQSNAASKTSASRDAKNPPPLPTVDLKKEDVRRTIIFIVDDLSMSFENGYNAKMALRNFVEKQMQPDDMIAILKTGYGNSAIQMFLSDKRQALARIDALQLEMALPPSPDNDDFFRIYGNQLSSLSYSLRALKAMSGRKILIMMTTRTMLYKPPVRRIEDGIETDFYDLYNERFVRLTDDALRSGVVVNFLNINGLNQERVKTPGLNTQSVLFGADAAGYSPPIQPPQGRAGIGEFPAAGLIPQNLARMRELAMSSRDSVANPLPEKTGGIRIENSNFFLDGVGKETESLMKGYYLISYAPPPDTFSSDGKEIYNQIKINVKRKNVKVYTREGFYNRLENEKDSTAPTDSLQDAIFSPFQHADLSINMSAGHVKDAQAGYLIRSWLHLDPENVKIVETEDGGARIDLEMICLTSDTNGYVQDSKRGQLTISHVNSPENIALLRQHGIRFAMLLPVKKPGSYYVHTAVEDKKTGKIGSAYQFVEIPDLEKKGLALSNIFMASGTEGLDWMRSDLTEEIAEGLTFPGFQDKEVRSPALRTYAIGDDLHIMAMLYGADDNAITNSEIEMQFVLYKDGAEFLRTGRAVSPGIAGNLEGIPLSLRMTMGTDIPPGNYTLQLLATDKKNSTRREGNASQAISFTVTEN